ncbi:MAG: helix-turn-helix transcriptional regulator [Anaerolineaceae bacterium]|jgi:DNA-binding transcriptional ArsR family regulator|nr:helix-turn-helix transcriptional regulator [Anaerolineaceae bacterium]
MDKPTRDPLFKVDDLETLKVLTDPLRIQIMAVLDPEPCTINYVAERLGLSSSRLYYHFNLLESHGLIQVVETRMVNNIVEKVFWTSSEELTVDSDLFKYSSDEGSEYLSRLVISTLDSVREDMIRSLEAEKFNYDHGEEKKQSLLLMSKVQKRIRTEDYLAYQKKLSALLEEYGDLPETGEDGAEMVTVSLACFFYPSHYYNDEHQEDKKE